MHQAKRNLATRLVWLPAIVAAGMALCLMLAGFTPLRIAENFTGLGAALGLLGFWLIVLALATACFVPVARRLTAAGSSRSWPWTFPEFVVAVALTGAVFAISAETYPANFIKYSWLQLVVLLLCGALTLSRFCWGDALRGGAYRALRLPVLLLLSYWFIRTAASSEPVRGAEMLIRLWTLAGWGLLLACILTRGTALKLLLLWLTLLGVLAAGYGCAQYAGYDIAGWGRGFNLPDIGVANRAMATFGNPNFLGAYLAIVIALPLTGMLSARERWQSVACGAGFCALLIGLLLTYNRAGYLAAAGACSVVLLCRKRGKIRRRWLVMALLGGLLIAPASVWERMVFWRHGLRGDDNVRIAIWEGTMNLVMANPLLGSGLGTFNQALPARLPPAFHEIFPRPVYVIEHAHSEWLEFWTETGTCGLALLLMLSAALARLLWQRHRAAPDDALPVLALAAGVAAVVHGLLETKLRYESTAVPLLFIIAAALAPEPALRRHTLPGPAVRIATGAAMLLALLPLLLCLRANQASKQAIDSLLADNPPTAVEAIAGALACNPDNLGANYQAINFLAAAPAPAALSGFVPAYSPALLNYQDAALGLARIASKRQRWYEAIQLLDYYAAHYPADANTPLLRVQLFLSAGQPLAALDLLNRIMPATPVAADQVNALRLETLARLGWKRTADRWLAELAPELTGGSNMLRRRLALAVTQRAWPAAMACLARIMPNYASGQLPGHLREQVELVVNGVAGEADAGDKYLMPIGDLLVAARQYTQARMVYRHAERFGADPELVNSRLACLGLTTDGEEILAETVQYFQQRPGGADAARYLRGRWLELRAASGRTPGGEELALNEYRALAEREMPHLGALARLQRMAGARRPEIAEVVRTAASRLGISAAEIKNDDPRWALAVMRNGGGASDSGVITLLVTPVLPVGEVKWRLTWEMDSVPIRYGRELRFAGPTGRTAMLRMPQLDPAATLSMPAAEVIAAEAIPVGDGDLRPPGYWLIGRVADYPPVRAWQLNDRTAAANVTQTVLARAPLRRPTAWPEERFPEMLASLSWWKYVSAQPRAFLRQVLRIGNRPPGIRGDSLLACLDELVFAGRQEVPGYLWQRPRRWGTTGDYWQRWRGTWVWEQQDFRCAIGELLVDERRWSEAIAWLRHEAQPSSEQRWLLARALTENGDRAAAAAVFAAAPAAERVSLPFLWYYGRWKKLVGLPCREEAAALEAGSADGWAGRLRGKMDLADCLAEPLCFEGGVQVVAMTPLPRFLHAGEAPRIVVKFISDREYPEIALMLTNDSSRHRVTFGNSWPDVSPGRIYGSDMPGEDVPRNDRSFRDSYSRGTMMLSTNVQLAGRGEEIYSTLCPVSGAETAGRHFVLGPLTGLPVAAATVGE